MKLMLQVIVVCRYVSIHKQLLMELFAYYCIGFAMFSTEQDSPPDMLVKQEEPVVPAEGEQQPGESEETVGESAQEGEEVERLEGGADHHALEPIKEEEEEPIPERMTLREIMKKHNIHAKGPTPSATLRHRWRQAIQAVILQNRRKRLKLSLGKSRINKNMSMLDRLERIEGQIFDIPNSLLNAMEEGLVSAATAMEKKVARVERLIEKNHTEHARTISNISTVVENMEHDLKEVDASVAKLSEMVEARMTSDLEMLNRVREVGDRVDSLEISHMTVVKKRVETVSEQLKQLEKSYQEVNNQVYEMIAKSAIAVDSKDEEVIVLLLEIDAKLKKNREAVMNIEGNARFLLRLVDGVRDELKEMASKSSESEVEGLTTACDDVTKSVDVIIKGVNSIHNFFNRHDDTIAERWLGFSKVITAAKSTATLSSKLKSLQSVVDEKPSRKTVLELIRESTEQFGAHEEKTEVLEATVASQAKEMEFLRSQLLELSESVAKQREETELMRLKEAEKAAAPAPAPSIDPAELNNVLNPMIKTIVDTYLASANLSSIGKLAGGAKAVKNQDVWFEDSGAYGSSSSSSGQIDRSEDWLRGDNMDFLDTLPEGENEQKSYDNTDETPTSDENAEKTAHITTRSEIDSFDFASSDEIVSARPGDTSSRSATPSNPATATPRGHSANMHAQTNFAKALRSQLKYLTDQLETLYKKKVDAEDFDKAMRFKADAVELVEKANQSVVDTIESTVKRVATELGDLRSVQTESAAVLRDELTRQLDEVLKKMLTMEADSDTGVGLASTKTLCLACGRSCRVRAHARPPPKSPRSQAIDAATRLDPADMVPNRSATPLHNMLSVDRSTSVVPLSPNRAVLRSRGPSSNNNNTATLTLASDRLDSMAESVHSVASPQPRTPSENPADRRKLEQLASKIGELQANAGLDASSLDASIDLVRPMHRKGFPGKKSSKAMVSDNAPYDVRNE